TVTVSGIQTVAALTFEEGNITLSTGGGISLSAGTVINVATGLNETLSSLLSGVSGFSKTGAGLIQLSNSSNTDSGSISISAGTLQITSSTTIGNTQTGAGNITLTNGG